MKPAIKQEYASAVMKQPAGVLVIMGFFLMMAAGTFVGTVRLPQPSLLGSWILLLNIVVLLFVAGGLYRMQGWSRWASIALFAIALVRIPGQLTKVHDVGFVTLQGLFALFFFWAIRYLTRPYATAAFRLASLRRSRENLHPPQPLPHP